MADEIVVKKKQKIDDLESTITVKWCYPVGQGFNDVKYYTRELLKILKEN